MVPMPGSRARVRSEQVRHSLEFVRLDRSVAVQIEHLESDPEMPESISQFPVLSLYRVITESLGSSGKIKGIKIEHIY
jgi:hypothetical protein